MPEYSIVAPAYNEQDVIGEFIRRIQATMASLSEDYEIVIVDDGSGDRTFDIVAAEARKDRRVRGVRLARNRGEQIAASAAIAQARGKHVIIMGADCEDPPEEIPKLLAEYHSGGWDMVYGLRERYPGGALRALASRAFYAVLARFTSIRLDPRQTFLRVMSRRFVAAFLSMGEAQRFLAGMWAWLGFKQTGVAVRTERRAGGQSKNATLGQQLRLAEAALVGFSTMAIRLTIGLGVVVTALSMLYLVIIVLGRVFLNWGLSGWPSLMGAVLVLGGFQIIAIGVVGLYVGQLFEQVKARPLYLVQETTEDGLS